MDFLNNLIFGIGIILIPISLYVTLVMMYHIFIGFWGFKKVERDYKLIKDKAKFLILVAAHNEEAVIASTVKNLKNINYDKKLFDVYVVNDNSTDKTGDCASAAGAKVITTSEGVFTREGVGKPGGLQYALRCLGFDKIKKKYDLVMILDADNHVDENILSELNSQWHGKGKPTVIQSYLDSKNHDKYLSLGYTVAYIVSNRFFQLSKYRLGLPCAIGGTGFVVTSEYLINSGGFNYKSLTEDLEMEIEIVRNNGKILWNHHTRVYDEKPDNIKVSVKQRTRWMQGHWYVAFTNFVPLAKMFFKTREWKYVDQLIYLFSGGKAIHLIVTTVSLVISSIALLLNGDKISLTDASYTTFIMLFGMGLSTMLLFIYGIFIQARYALKVDKGLSVSLKSTISLFYYAYTFLYCNIKGLFKWRQQGVWYKTEHKVTKRTE